MSGFVGEPPPRGGGLAGAAADPGRRFDDVFNLVADPAFLVLAWIRVRENKGAKTAGIDGDTAWMIERNDGGVQRFLERLRSNLKDRSFVPAPVRQVMIPKPGTRKKRRLGIPTARDRVVQAALKLVLEPILGKHSGPGCGGLWLKRRTGWFVACVGDSW